MKVLISQPRYLPAINYLQRLYFADLFVFLNNVQRQARGWENRNKILIDGNEKWITIPVSSSSRVLIKDTKISGKDWIDVHKNIINNAYRKHPYYDKKIVDLYYADVKEALEKNDYSFTDCLVKLTINACKIFDFQPNLAWSSFYDRTDEIKGPKKLLEICRATGATTYISGANGRKYGIVDAFKGGEIEVKFHDYEYPLYDQFGGKNYVPWLSFFDPIFNVGLETVKKWIYKQPRLTEE